jgi:hypothetical protein
MAPRLITKAVHQSLQKRVRVAAKDVAKVRCEALAKIAAAKSGAPGKCRLVREDECGAYIMARAHLASARGSLVNIQIM